jgi:hypothetical protein
MKTFHEEYGWSLGVLLREDHVYLSPSGLRALVERFWSKLVDRDPSTPAATFTTGYVETYGVHEPHAWVARITTVSGVSLGEKAPTKELAMLGALRRFEITMTHLLMRATA